MKNVNAAIVADTNARLFLLQQKFLKENYLLFFKELRILVEKHEKPIPRETPVICFTVSNQDEDRMVFIQKWLDGEHFNVFLDDAQHTKSLKILRLSKDNMDGQSFLFEACDFLNQGAELFKGAIGFSGSKKQGWIKQIAVSEWKWNEVNFGLKS